MTHIWGPSCPGCEAKLAQVRPEMSDWFHKVKAQHSDVHIAWGYRGQVDQDAAVASGHSELPWPKSPHNQLPSLAIDIFQEDQKGHGTYDPIFMAKIAAQFSSGIKWGGAWKSLGDSMHFQLDLTQEPLPPAC